MQDFGQTPSSLTPYSEDRKLRQREGSGLAQITWSVCSREGIRIQAGKIQDLCCPLSHLAIPGGTPLPQLHSAPESQSPHSMPPADCLLPTGPLCSLLVGRFGCRVTMMLGGVLASLGMVASAFSRTLMQFFLTAGVITGDCHSI